MTHYLFLLKTFRYIGFRYNIRLKQRTNICCFHRPLVISKNSALYLNLLVRYCRFKKSCILTCLEAFEP